MSDSHQAIYDAVRSRISNGDIGAAVESVLRAENIGHYASMAAESVRQAVCQTASEHERPSAIWRPKLSIDGDQWCALYGDNLQDGVAGFGGSPADAMDDFDRNWTTKLASKAARDKRSADVLREMGFPELRANGAPA